MREPDLVTMALKLAYEQHSKGDMTDDELIEVMQMCINARAIENGYAEEFGLPFPDHEAPNP